MSMKTCLFLSVILKVTLVLMCLECHFDIIGKWKLIVGNRDINYAKKILNAFVCVEVRNLVEKWNIYEVQIFLRPLLQTCRLETTFFVFKCPVTCKKNFQFLIIFIEINVKVCLFCAHHELTSIIHHTRRPNCQ